MGKNSKKHRREYDKRQAEWAAKNPEQAKSHPSWEDIFAEYEIIGGIIYRRVEKDKPKLP